MRSSTVCWSKLRDTPVVPTPRTDLVETRLSFFCSVGFLFLSCISIVVFNFLIATALVFVCVCFLRGVFCAQGGRAGLVLKSAAVTG